MAMAYIKLQLIKDVISHPYGIAKVPKDMGQNPLRANVYTMNGGVVTNFV